MKHLSRIVLAVIVAGSGLWLLASTGREQTVQDPEVQFQRAVQLETIEGNLNAAIDLYKQVIKNNGNNRAVAAKALLRLGGCYEKLGEEEARKTYQQLVNDYADQQQEVKLARERLVVLAATDAKPRFTKVRVPTGLPSNARFALSPNGQQLAYVEKGSVWLVPVHGETDPAIAGAPRQISPPITSWTETTDITWSRDGKWLALHIRESDAPNLEYAVYMVSSNGGDPRRVTLELKSRERIFHDSRLSLSPDGKRLAYTTWPENGSPADRSVYLAPTGGGPAVRLTQPLTSDPAFSPDGKRIAYLGLAGSPDWQPGAERGRQLWITPVEGGSPIQVYELAPPGRIASPTWSPDGRTLAVLVNHVNSTDDCREMLLIPVGPDGRASGSPARLTLPYSAHQWPGGWDSGDRIGLILSRPAEAAIYTVSSSGGKAVQLTPDWAVTPAWTPDGKRIYFEGSHFGGSATIEYVPSRGGKMEKVNLRFSGPNPVALYGPGTISVSPDGKSVLFYGSYRGSANRFRQIFSVPVEGGEVVELTQGIPATNACWSPDGESIAFISRGDIYIQPLKGGQARKLTSRSDQVAYGGIAWSPDGGRLAFHSEEGRKIKLMPVAGGQARVLVEGCTGGPMRGLAWSPDGKELLYSTESRIWRLNLETGKSEEVQTGLKLIQAEMAWSPDGKTIAFSGVQEAETELWLMADFLPSVRRRSH